MNIDLTGQTTAVIGAGNGIGRAIANAFLESGSHILALDRDADALEDFRRVSPEKITCSVVDIGDYASLQSVSDDLADGIDHLICSAAIGSGKTGFPFWNLNPSDWESVLEVTLMGTVNSVHAFATALLKGETKRKSVLLISSVAGQIGSQTDPPYSASKAAVINFAQCAAKDFASYGVRVNAMSPGMVKTDLNESVWAASKESADQSYEEWAQEKIGKISPLARWQTPEEFGAMAVFLASEHGKNITGQTINIDGGQVMHS